jgi:DNA-binding transcriptional LysR family regulator
MTERFDLTDLRLFVHVADASNITNGALRANMTLASASERIRSMELDLGTPLLVRKRRGVELTAAGTALLHHARLVTQQLEHMRGDLNDYAKGLRAHVHVRSNTMGISEILPARLARFLSAHPNIDVDVEEGRSPDIVRAVAAGRVEIGIVAEGLEAAAELETLPIGDYRFAVVVPLRHELARRRQISFREVLDYDLVGLRADSAWQNFLNEQATRAGKRLRLRARLDGFDAICRMVENQIGIAVVPEPMARRWAQKLKVIPLDEAWALRHLTLCVRNLASLSPHAQRLVKYLTQPSPGEHVASKGGTPRSSSVQKGRRR